MKRARTQILKSDIQFYSLNTCSINLFEKFAMRCNEIKNININNNNKLWKFPFEPNLTKCPGILESMDFNALNPNVSIAY